jgi:hypothetical protein
MWDSLTLAIRADRVDSPQVEPGLLPSPSGVSDGLPGLPRTVRCELDVWVDDFLALETVDVPGSTTLIVLCAASTNVATLSWPCSVATGSTRGVGPVPRKIGCRVRTGGTGGSRVPRHRWGGQDAAVRDDLNPARRDRWFRTTGSVGCDHLAHGPGLSEREWVPAAGRQSPTPTLARDGKQMMAARSLGDRYPREQVAVRRQHAVGSTAWDVADPPGGARLASPVLCSEVAS